MKTILLIMAILVTCDSRAALFRKKTPKASEKPAEAQLLLAPITNQFQFIDSEQFFEGLFKGWQKSEFETEAEFKERRLRETPSGMFYAQIPAEQLTYIYSAENQRLAVFVKPGLSGLASIRDRARSDANNYVVAALDELPRKQMMQNAFGATVEVTKLVSRHYQITPSNLMDLPLVLRWRRSDSDPSVGLGLPIRILPSEAQEKKESQAFTLIVGFSCENVEKVHQDVTGLDAKINLPIQTTYALFSIPVKVHSLHLFEPKTGMILTGWPAQ